MRWTCKGHEYDKTYENICRKKNFMLFGAGDYGNQILPIIKNEIEIIGYIDNAPEKAGKIINGLPCITLKDARLSDETGIIITMSQIAKVSAVEQLIKMGYKEGRDYFPIEEFLSVYFVYKYNEVWFANISFLPSTACNLNCRYCLNFNPFTEKFYVRELNRLKADVDTFFKCVDHIMLFHVSGGETFLYPYIAEIVGYIHDEYGSKIDKLRMVTNGTVVPKDEVLQKLSNFGVEITVDDYRDALPECRGKYNELLKKLKKFHINYYQNKVDSWIDLAPDKTDFSHLSEDELVRHRSECNQTWQELRDGKLYSCNYAAYAVVTGQMGEQDKEETYDLVAHDASKNKELVEFRLGYTDKGYTNFCKHCRGFTPQNCAAVIPAEQTIGRKMKFLCNNK